MYCTRNKIIHNCTGQLKITVVFIWQLEIDRIYNRIKSNIISCSLFMQVFIWNCNHAKYVNLFKYIKSFRGGLLLGISLNWSHFDNFVSHHLLYDRPKKKQVHGKASTEISQISWFFILSSIIKKNKTICHNCVTYSHFHTLAYKLHTFQMLVTNY